MSNNINFKITSDAKMATESLHGLSKSFTVLSRDGKRADTTLTGFVKSLFSLKGVIGAISLYKLTNMFVGFTKSAMDMTESIHLFNVAMGDMAEDTEKVVNTMSQISGLDNTKLLDTVGSYNLLARSMGVTAKNAQVLSVNTSKLAIDLSALTNRSIQKVSEDLRSGLIGQAKTMYKYGIDVTEASIKQEALNRGIQKSVRHMSQAEKMTLRYAVMIRQASLSHGDFAKTIETPANQLRILSERMLTLGRTIGTMFIPMISKVLPWINALVMVLTRLAQALARLFGYKGESPIKNMKNDFSGGADGADDLADSVGGAGKKVDKLKKKLQSLAGFDELNILKTKEPDTPDSGGGKKGGGDLGGFDIDLEGYDNLFDSIGQKSEEIANRITKAFEQMVMALEPTIQALKRLWNEGLFLLGNFVFHSLMDFYNHFLVPVGKWVMGEGLPRFIDALNKMLKDINWGTIMNGLKGLWDALTPFAITIGEGLLWFWENVLTPLGTWVMNDLLIVFLKLLTTSLEVLNIAIEALKPLGAWLFDNLLKPLAQWTGDLIIGSLELLNEKLQVLGEWIQEHPQAFEVFAIVLGSFATAIGLVVGAVALLKGGIFLLGVAWKAFNLLFVATPIGMIILALTALIATGVLLWKNWDETKNIAQNIWGAIDKVLTGFFTGIVNFAKKEWEQFKKDIDEIFTAIAVVAKKIWDGIDKTLTFIFTGIVKVAKTIWDGLNAFFLKRFNEWNELFDTVFNGLANIIKIVWDAIKTTIETAVNGLYTFLKTGFDNIKSMALTVWNGIKDNILSPMTKAKEQIEIIWGKIKTFIGKLWGDIKTGIIDTSDALVTAIKSPFLTVETWITDFIGNAKDWGSNLIEGFIDGIKSTGKKVSGAVKGVVGNVKDYIGFQSPTKKGDGRYADKWMPNMMDMFVDGIKDNEYKIASAMEMTVQGLSGGMRGGGDNNLSNSLEGAIMSGMSNAMRGQGDNGTPIVVNVGGKTLVDTVVGGINRQSRISGKNVITV